MIGKHQIIPTYKNRKPWVYVYNLAILLPGGNWYYHCKNLASQTGLNQSSTSGCALIHWDSSYLLSGYCIYGTHNAAESKGYQFRMTLALI